MLPLFVTVTVIIIVIILLKLKKFNFEIFIVTFIDTDPLILRDKNNYDNSNSKHDEKIHLRLQYNLSS